MKKTITYFTLLTLLLLAGCRKETIGIPDRDARTDLEDHPEMIATADMVPGEAIVKLRSDAEGEAVTRQTRLRSLISSELRSLSDEVEMEPVFEIGGPYEALQREAGLDLWYRISFDEKADLSEVLTRLRKSTGDLVERVDGSRLIAQPAATYTPVSSLRAAREDKFNQGYPGFQNADPLLPYQWHYVNEGSESNPAFSIGADINLFNAWKVETGKHDVIVAIIDSGVDAEHPDLKESMWEDPEHPGGHGFNFVDSSYDIKPGFHGTHVAGTIAARNNNGIGVSGIAGGDGTRESGVRLMSIQIFGPDNLQTGMSQPAKIEQIAKGFQWAAEHGASIVNCSWGFNDTRVNNDYPVIHDAIKYFVKNAGVDPKTREQKVGSRMKGGVIFFASGNESLENHIVHPACYDEVVSVAAFGPNMKRTGYSNIADWVDIMAPGGSFTLRGPYEGGILSTITSTFADMPVPETMFHGRDFLFPQETRYALQQGTSMATPHVTGIAALVLSKFGKQGFTADDLKKRILSSVKQVDHKALHDKRIRDWLGVGYIDAARALEEDKGAAPKMTGEPAVKEQGYLDATISWMPAKDEDAIDGLATEYTLTLTAKGAEARTVKIPNYGHKEGTAIEYKLDKLTDGTKYHVTLTAHDRWGHSAKSEFDFETKTNHAPAVTNLPKTLPLVLSKSKAFHKLSLEIKDEDGHSWSLKEAIEKPGVKATLKEGKGLDLLFLITDIEPGDYSLPIVLVDELGKESKTDVTYKVVTYEAVKQMADFGHIVMGQYDEPIKVELKDKFVSPVGLGLSFSAGSSKKEVATARILSGSTLELTPKSVGSTMIHLTVSDGTKEVTSGFTLTVTGDSEAARAAGGTFILYPVPTESVLHIQTGANTALPREIIITTMRGDLVLRQYIDRGKEGISHVSLEKLAPGVYRAHLGKTVRTIIKK